MGCGRNCQDEKLQLSVWPKYCSLGAQWGKGTLVSVQFVFVMLGNKMLISIHAEEHWGTLVLEETWISLCPSTLQGFHRKHQPTKGQQSVFVCISVRGSGKEQGFRASYWWTVSKACYWGQSLVCAFVCGPISWKGHLYQELQSRCDLGGSCVQVTATGETRIQGQLLGRPKAWSQLPEGSPLCVRICPWQTSFVSSQSGEFKGGFECLSIACA